MQLTSRLRAVALAWASAYRSVSIFRVNLTVGRPPLEVPLLPLLTAGVGAL
jgi:hypothetical protein